VPTVEQARLGVLAGPVAPFPGNETEMDIVGNVGGGGQLMQALAGALDVQDMSIVPYGSGIVVCLVTTPPLLAEIAPVLKLYAQPAVRIVKAVITMGILESTIASFAPPPQAVELSKKPQLTPNKPVPAAPLPV
jgi:hypothetical protein